MSLVTFTDKDGDPVGIDASAVVAVERSDMMLVAVTLTARTYAGLGTHANASKVLLLRDTSVDEVIAKLNAAGA